MASWNLPADDPDDTAECAHTLAADYLQSRGCDPTCQALGALLSADLVRHAACGRGERIALEIDHAEHEVELRVNPALLGSVAGNNDTLHLLRRLATSWGYTSEPPAIWCRFACLEGHPRPCTAHHSEP
jgi:hypothetical protein